MDDCANVTCLNDGKCKEMLNNFTCDCHPGFRGEYCKENINECQPRPCRNGGSCVDGIAGYTCLCTEKWLGKLSLRDSLIVLIFDNAFIICIAVVLSQ